VTTWQQHPAPTLLCMLQHTPKDSMHAPHSCAQNSPAPTLAARTPSLLPRVHDSLDGRHVLPPCAGVGKHANRQLAQHRAAQAATQGALGDSHPAAPPAADLLLYLLQLLPLRPPCCGTAWLLCLT
jgi:hypothetical protein